MHVLEKLAILITAFLLLGRALSAPILRVSPGGTDAIIITKENTLNATALAPSNGTVNANANANANLNLHTSNALSSTGKLPLGLVNNSPSGQINSYITGLDSQNRLVMLKPDGTFYYPSSQPGQNVPQLINANVAIPLGASGTTTPITIPDYISSGRVWVAAGELRFYTVWSQDTNGPSMVQPSALNPADPSSSANWSFTELTYTKSGGLYINLSYVDLLGLPVGIEVQAGDGSTQSARGVHPGAASAMCKALVAQTAKDGMPWSDLCQANAAGEPLRVISPADYISLHPTAFQDYFTDSVNQAWSHYATNPLLVDTQSAAGDVTCKVSNDVLQCAGDNRAYAKPSAKDIFGCNSGPFEILPGDNGVHQAVVPRLCAAFTRGTLLLNGGHVQPSLQAKSYYKAGAVNWYSAFVHDQEIDGKGYAFSYDDVNPSGAVDQSGVVTSSDPKLLTFFVGGPQ